MTAPKKIGIAIVENQRRFLVGIRADDVPLAGYAEFPGGKCIDDESPVDCAVRECREESGLDVIAQEIIERCEFAYAHGLVNLHFVLCKPADLNDVRDHHEQFRWVPVEELKSLKFPEANVAVIELLVRWFSQE